MSEIHQVVLWQDGIVMTMDEAGNQMPGYQGPLAEVRESILRDAPPSAGFQRGTWGVGAAHQLVRIRRADFAALVDMAREAR